MTALPISAYPPHNHLRLAVDLTGTGATRVGGTPAAPGQPQVKAFDVRVLLEQVQLAQRASFDFVALGDSFSLAPSASNALLGQVDAALIAARIAPVLQGIGLIPAVNTTHTEPFHVSKLVATLDHVSGGFGGWEPTVSVTGAEARLFGRKGAQTPASAWAEAEEVADVVAKLWDSWEDDAEIRDVANHRFIDRDKLHYVDYEGVHFSVKGPSITPRPPQGHPVTVISIPSASEDPRVRDQVIEIASQRADVVRLNAASLTEAIALRAALKHRAAVLGRNPKELLVYINLHVVVGQDEDSAQVRRDLLGSADELPLTFTGTPAQLGQLGAQWLAAGAADGLVLIPGSLSTDLRVITEQTVPLWAAQELLRPGYRGATLRENLGLPRPANQFALANIAHSSTAQTANA